MAKPQTIHTVESLLARTVDVGECKEWLGYSNNNNPRVYHEGRLQPTRKVLCKLNGQHIPPGFFVGTSCGNRKCVNPAHAVIRTPRQHAVIMAENVDHMHPSRLLKLTEKAQVRRKLTDEQLEEIRMTGTSRRILAEKFAVNPSLISRIRAGKAHRMSAARNNPFFRLMG